MNPLAKAIMFLTAGLSWDHPPELADRDRRPSRDLPPRRWSPGTAQRHRRRQRRRTGARR